MVNKYGEILTDDSKYGLLIFNNGTVCDTKGAGILDTSVAGAICKVMGYESAGYMQQSDKPNWSMRLGFKTSMYDISCPKKYGESKFWYFCSYELGSNKDCERHNKDVFLKCKCNYPSDITCAEGMYLKDKCLCTPCPRDTYKDVPGPETFCKACPRRSTSPPGSASCTCKAGYYWSLGRCHQCAQGSVSVEGSDQCLKCPLDSIEVNYSTACKCLPGKGWSWEGKNKGECKPCLPGTYISGDMTSCQPCPINTTSDHVGSDHCICPAGMFWNNTKCQNCEQGSVSQHGALRCQICPSKSSINGTSCDCLRGKVWSWDEHLNTGSCKLHNSWKFTFLIGCNVGMLLLIVSITVTLAVLKLIKGRRNRRSSEVNVINTPYAE